MSEQEREAARDSVADAQKETAPPFNELIAGELERLALLNEECSEVGQIISKILRHGYESYHPDNRITSNRELLEKEIGDVLYAIHLIKADLNEPAIHRAASIKGDKIAKYLHHAIARPYPNPLDSASSRQRISELVRKAIDDEPELPGPLDPAMWDVLKQAITADDQDIVTEAFRITVRLTKQGIRERFQAALGQQESGECGG